MSDEQLLESIQQMFPDSKVSIEYVVQMKPTPERKWSDTIFKSDTLKQWIQEKVLGTGWLREHQGGEMRLVRRIIIEDVALTTEDFDFPVVGRGSDHDGDYEIYGAVMKGDSEWR